MKALRVAVDSSCLIGLVHIDLFETLPELFLEIHLPVAVYDEIAIKGQGKTGADEIADAVKAGWLKKTAVRDQLAIQALTTTISEGEAEVIVLTKILRLDYALIDEKMARNVAALMNVRTVGVLGVIDMAISAGFPIDKKAAIDLLRHQGFRISEKLYRKVLST